MKVKIDLIETSQAIEIEAINTYTKGNLYCVYDGEKVIKFPLSNVWRIVEDYGVTATRTP